MTDNAAYPQDIKVGDSCSVRGRQATVLEVDLRNDGIPGVRVEYLDNKAVEWVDLPPVRWWWPRKSKVRGKVERR
jgi:hypothetical protein